MTFSIEIYLAQLTTALEKCMQDGLDDMGIDPSNLAVLGQASARSSLWFLMNADEDLVPLSSEQKKEVKAYVAEHYQAKTLKAFIKQHFEQMVLAKVNTKPLRLTIANTIVVPDVFSPKTKAAYTQILQLIESNLRSILPEVAEDAGASDDLKDNLWFDEISEQVEMLLEEESAKVQRELQAFAEKQGGDDFVSDHVYGIYERIYAQLQGLGEAKAL